MSKIRIGVDQADGETTVIFVRIEEDGTFLVIAELRGEAAEYVAGLEEDKKRLERENQKMRLVQIEVHKFIQNEVLIEALMERLGYVPEEEVSNAVIRTA